QVAQLGEIDRYQKGCYVVFSAVAEAVNATPCQADKKEYDQKRRYESTCHLALPLSFPRILLYCRISSSSCSGVIFSFHCGSGSGGRRKVFSHKITANMYATAGA